jgi:dTDP-glucose 4,6-dehydratase
MCIIVTGGTGFIGSNLVRLLVAQGHQVLSIDKLTCAGNPRSLSDLDANPSHRLLKADICDADAMRVAFAEFRPEWVMHLAAESHVDPSIDGLGEFIQTNFIGTYTLLQAAREYWRSLKEVAARKQETGNRKQETGNRKQETGNRKQETGNRKQGLFFYAVP